MNRITLLSSTEKALKEMPWLEKTDAAARQLAKTYARILDEAVDQYDRGEMSHNDFTRMMKLGPDLLAALKALGGTPETRKALRAQIQEATTLSPEDELKARRAARAAGG